MLIVSSHYIGLVRLTVSGQDCLALWEDYIVSLPEGTPETDGEWRAE